MKTHFYHIQLNINFENAPFYKDLMSFLGWKVIFEGEGVMGFKSGTDGDVWFLASKNSEQQDYDTIGMNHISFRTDHQGDVDKVVEHLKAKHIEALFETPRHRPEFSESDKHTYYQVIFETPDKIQVEVVYVGPKK